VYIDGCVPLARASAQQAVPPPQWPVKDPADVLDYQVDISAAMVGNPGDSIASADIAIVPSLPGDLQLNSIAIDGQRVLLWLANGQSGTLYEVTVTMVTINGRVLQRGILLPVQAMSNQDAPPGALQIGTGAPLLDQNGNPILA
jgi:hypothetical protein